MKKTVHNKGEHASQAKNNITFFKFVRQHCGLFFWIGWLYVLAIGIVEMTFDTEDWFLALTALPLNFISWPVLVESRKANNLPRPVLRTAVALVAVSSLLPLLILIDFLGNIM